MQTLSLLSFVTGLSLLATSVAAQEADPIYAYIDKVEAAQQELSERYGYDNAPETLDAAFRAAGVDWARRYTDPWGNNGLFLDLDAASSFYHRAEEDLEKWADAVEDGDVSVDDAISELVPAMEHFDRVHQIIELGFQDEVLTMAEKAWWLDRHEEEANCLLPIYDCEGDRAAYEATKAAAERARAASRAPDWHWIGGLDVIPDPGVDPVEARRQATEDVTQISDTLPDDPDFEMRRQAAVKLQGAIVAAGATSDDPVLGAIDLARERQRLAQRDVESLLDRAASAEHPVYRDRYLARAGDALMDQAGHFAPQAVAEALEDGAESGALADFLDSLQRLSTQLDDVFGSESGFGPTGDFLGGLNAAAEVAEMRGEEATASEIAGIINDIGGAAGEGIYLKPFATQFGAITGQVGQARDGWDATSSAIQGVADAVGGDLTGLERAEAAADQVAEALNPENMVSAMVEGAAGAFDTLIPGTRGAATNVLASIFG